METARAAKGSRRHNLSLRQLTPRRGQRDPKSADRAFESFYRKHVAEVYQYALAVLTNPADAEDVTQQTFLNAYRAFQNGERPHTPHNWLIKIAHNVCRMRWRQSSRRPQEVPLENAAEPAAFDDEKPALDEVLAALARLPFNQRAAIVMREVEGRTYSEIADVMNTTVPAVEALLFRARTNLRARRKALGVLTLAPLPGSLSTFFGGGGGGLVAAGGAVLGSELALKAAAVVVSGVVAGGLGFKAVKAVAKAEPSHRLSAQTYRRHADPSPANPVRRATQAGDGSSAQRIRNFHHPARARRRARGGELRKAPTNDKRSETTAGTSGGSAAAGGTSSGNGAIGPVPTTQHVTVAPSSTVKNLVPTVPVQTPPAPLPVPPAPPLPTVAVTVTAPTLPLPVPPPLK